jgi:N-acetylmuramoyl-L-alanine amidase
MALWAAASAASSQVRVAIDAAHGGADPGSRSGSAIEKEWNLRFAKAVAKALKDAGFMPVLVREKDETLELKDRVDRLNAAEAALAIVVHADRDLTGTRRGPLLVVQPPTGAPDPPGLLPWGWVPTWRHRSSVRLAKSLARSLGVGASFNALSDRGGSGGETLSWDGRILCASHANLRYVTAPAVVLTPLFLTSKADLEAFSDDSSVEAFATRVVTGVQEFLHAGGEENP